MMKFLFGAMYWFDYQWFLLQRMYHKLKDYDRIENDYVDVLSHATSSRLLNPYHDTEVVKRVINEVQESLFVEGSQEFIIGAILNSGGDHERLMDEIMNYFQITEDQLNARMRTNNLETDNNHGK